MNKYKKLAFNSGLFTVANFGSRLMNFLFMPFYTYWLTTSQLGTADTMVLTVNLFAPLVTLSLQDAVLRYVMTKNADVQKILSCALICPIFTSLLSGICSYFIFQQLPVFRDYWFLFFLLLILQSFNTIFLQFSRGIGRLKVFALNGVINTAAQIVSNFLFLGALHLDISGYLLALIVAYLVANLHLVIHLRIWRYLSIRKICKPMLKQLLVFSIPLIPTAIMWWAMNSSNNYIIIWLLGTGAAGIYTIATKIPHVINMLFTIFQQAWQISAIEDHEEGSDHSFQSSIYNTLIQLLILGTSVFLLLEKPVVQLLLEQSYHSAWKYIPFLFLSAVFSSLSSFLGTNYVVTQKTTGAFKTSAVCAVVNTVAALALTPLIGLYGTATASLLAFFVLWIYRAYDTNKLIRLELQVKRTVLSLLLLAVQVAVLLLIDHWIMYVLQVVVSVVLFFVHRSLLVDAVLQIRKFLKAKKYT